MKLKKPHPQIFLFLGDSPRDLGEPFVRLQEFYESPSPKFRRRMFTVEEFKGWYRRTQSRTRSFSYFTDFYGYNVPGDIFQAFYCLYSDCLTTAELRLLKMMGETPLRFYVIGAPKDSADTIDHEISHAFWHLFPQYRQRMMCLQKHFDLSEIHRYLRENMYAADMMNDESASYVMFDDAILHRAGVSTKNLRPLKESMLAVYGQYKTAHIDL